MDRQEDRELDFNQAITDDIKTGDSLAHFRTLSRRDFLKLSGVTLGAVALGGPGEFARLFTPEIQFPNRTYQLPLPTGTHLRSVENQRGVDSKSLELMNGDPRQFSGTLNTRVLWLPGDTPEPGATNSKIGPVAERLIKDKFLIARAMIERDETTDSCWPAEETIIIQGLLHKAMNRAV